ncbi:PrgI family protein [Bacillus cereus]|nr:PrgI family protein [Bacillus cereus]MEC3260916.1 PrgI family protein [Bacillus cereus]
MEERNYENYENPYLIPKNIKARFELIPGFGWREIFVTFTGLVIGLLLLLLLGVFGVPFILRLFLTVLCAGVGYGISVPNPRTGLNLLDILKMMKQFRAKPKRYYYVFGEGREKN